MKKICIVKFNAPVTHEVVEANIALSIIVAEALFGQARVKMYAGYYIKPKTLETVIDSGSEVGEFVATAFVGLMLRKVGDDGFMTEMIERAEMPERVGPVRGKK